MDELTNNQKFVLFLNGYDGGSHDDNNYYDTIREISRKKSKKRDALIPNDFLMYSLDDIAKGSRRLRRNLPKTVDALYYRFDDENDDLSLYLIEFKFHNLDDPNPEDVLEELVDEFYAFPKKFKCINKYKSDLNKIKKYYGDDVKHNLILKPIESIRVVIPELYEEYCKMNPNAGKIDIEEYLDNIEKKLFVFVSTYTVEGKYDPNKERSESQGTDLERHFDRLVNGKIIDNYEIHPRSYFEDFLINEKLE